jgi:malic enzyme
VVKSANPTCGATSITLEMRKACVDAIARLARAPAYDVDAAGLYKMDAVELKLSLKSVCFQPLHL